ncbi:MAG: glycosyltransferase family 4 protein [Cyanobacteria bacterium SZAS-4]|nr:glycosyltransferase family 4 protein [Cyanobacteria bacterium SZAS-4]
MSDDTTSKLLFCLLNNKVGGGNRILFELANRSLQAGFDAKLYFLDKSGPPTWFANSCKIAENSIESELSDYDFVFVSNASAVPALLPHCDINKLVLVCQGFESYCYGETINDLLSPKPSIENILKIGNPIIATSKSIQSLIKNNVGRDSLLVPVAIDKDQFATERSQLAESESVRSGKSPKRILAVGDYRAKFKGMLDLADALKMLNKEIPIELVLLTQQKVAKDWFKNYDFPIEFNCNPPQSELAALYASCHVYCCASWYEGFGLPCLEAFSVGIPVVSTNNFGVTEFARDGENILLARPHSPNDLAAKLRTLLTDSALRQSLIENGTATADKYTWQQTMSCFFETLKQMEQTKSDAVAPTQTELEFMLEELENHGYYTPPQVEQALSILSIELQTLCRRIKEGDIDEAESTQMLQQIRQQLKVHLHNPASSYYKEFKARFDLCQMFSVIENPKDWQKMLSFSES